MANVLFKQGLQANLDTIRTNLSAIEGTFYLTTDSHRLYIGRITTDARSSAAITAAGGSATQDATHCDAVPVNQGVTFVTSLSNLPAVNAANKTQYAGQFYYVADKNILCVYNGDSWVQINPNTDTHVDGVEINVTTTNGVAKVETVVKNTTPNGVTGGQSYKDTFNIAGAGGAKVSSSGDTVTITGEQYELETSVNGTTKTATVKLKSASGEDDSTVNIVAGSNVTIAAGTDATHDITISSKDTQLKEVTGGNGDGTASGKTGFYIKVADTDNNTKTGKIDPVIKVGNDNTLSENQIHFDSGVATLPVYTKNEIDGLLKSFNAMEFKGVLTSAPSSTDVHAGDTYKAGSSFSFSNNGTAVTVNKGDLLIATGTEVNGVIPAGNLKWEIIASGDDTVITYQGESISHGIQLKEKPSADVVAKFDLSAGTGITLKDTANKIGSGSSEKTIGTKVTITHDDVARAADVLTNTYTQQYNSYTNSTIEAITGITTNAQGHVTGVTKAKWQLKDTNGLVKYTNTQINTTSAVNNGITQYTAKLTNGVTTYSSDGTKTGSASNDYSIKSSSLQISSTAATITAGSGQQTAAASMTIDMVWGTF